jgi:hypothetical protein
LCLAIINKKDLKKCQIDTNGLLRLCVVCGLWFVVCGLWFVVCGLWFVVCGLWLKLKITT